MKKILLTLLGVLLALPGIARDFTYEYEGQTLTYTVIDEDAKTCQTKAGNYYGAAGNSVSGVLVIPSLAKDGDVEYAVTSISHRAFIDCSYLTSVTIPNSVNSIGNQAFNGCSRLTSVIIPNSVTEIGSEAFEDCSGLTSMIIPNSVNSIGYEAFWGCSGLIKSAYPSGLSNPFYHHTPIQYPREGAIIEEGFVYGPEKSTIYFAPLSLEGEYVIPGSVTEIGEYAFYDCSGMTSVTILNSVNSIGANAFDGCSGLTSVIIPNSVNSIGANAFDGCSGLTSVIIPNSVNSIGANAFDGCSGLKKSAYPSGLSNPFSDGTSIQYPREGAIIEEGFVYGPEKNAIYFAPLSFEGEYIIPNSVTSIGSSAFSGCSGLTDLVIEDSDKNLHFGEEVFTNAGLRNVYLGRNFDYEGQYTSSGPFYNSKISELTISSTVTKFDVGAFHLCESLTSVEIPNSVTSIGNYAFYDCTGLTSVIIGNSVASIGEKAFNGCSGLTSIIATAANPPMMHDSSFSGLYATAALSVPDGAVTDYLATNWSLFESLRSGGSDEALKTYETGNLKYRLIPGKTDADKNLAVVIPGNYSSLTEVTIPERFTVPENGKNARYYVDGIGFKAFNGCSNLATITFNSHNAATCIGDYAFAGTKIAALSIPATAETIGNHAFDGCKSLASIAIPTSVKTIGNYAFNSCTALTEITVPGSVESIGDYAFNSCTALTNANLEAGVKTIGDYAFYNTPLNEITLNEGLETIGEKCFSASRDRDIEPVYIPSTLKSVGADAFMNFNCQYVNISDLAPWCNIDFGNENSNPAAHRQGLYLNGEKIEDLVIPESVNAITDFAFCYNSGLKSVKFNDALQSIGESAFKYCGGLTAAVIPGNVTAIGNSAFSGTNIKDVTFAYGANSIDIGSYAFSAPTSLSWDRPIESLNLVVNSLKSLTIGNSVTEIPATKFKNASKLTSLVLGNSLTAIGDEAFSGCTALTEVILPPSVETIGASVFAGNSKLTSIIMGHKVTTIGEKAYDLCPAQTVSITAQTPPTAPDNTFSNYTGSLYVQGQTAADAYYDADYCWYQFEGHVMIEPTEMKVEGDKTLNGKPGDTFQLIAKLYPDDVTLPQIFWRSTNPDIATVDANGLVTLHADLSEVMTMAEGDDDATARSCKIIAESLYADGPVAEFTVEDVNSSVISAGNDSNDGAIDYSAPYEVYSINGMKVADTTDDLAPGIYIIRQGKNVEKVALH